RARLDLRGAGGVRVLAARQGTAGRPAVRVLRRAATAAAAIRRGGAAVPGLPHAPVRAVHPRAGAGGAPRGLSSGPDEAVPQRGKMMLDLLITNAALPDGRTGMAVAVHDGRITEVTQGLQAQAAET